MFLIGMDAIGCHYRVASMAVVRWPPYFCKGLSKYCSRSPMVM